MNKKIIIIEGYLASGKSNFATRLSKELNIPCFIKDTFKTALCSSLEISDRKTSSQFSAITFDGMMYVASKLMTASYPLILEGNFVSSGIKKVDEAKMIKELINKYDYQSLTIKFTGNTKVLYQRFIERESLSLRGQANMMFDEVIYEDFNKWCHNLDEFNIGGAVIRIDTTDFATVDFDAHIKTIKDFIKLKIQNS